MWEILYVWRSGHLSARTCKYGKPLLKQRYQQHTAYDVSKLSLEELFPYVAAGNPVLLWLTSDLEDPYFSSQSVEYGGIHIDGTGMNTVWCLVDTIWKSKA